MKIYKRKVGTGKLILKVYQDGEVVLTEKDCGFGLYASFGKKEFEALKEIFRDIERDFYKYNGAPPDSIIHPSLTKKQVEKFKREWKKEMAKHPLDVGIPFDRKKTWFEKILCGWK